ncbi:MAG: peptidylprolyl isomerase [Planctomycetota bacterium]
MVSAREGSTVKVHYTGKLEDGTVFDSSVEREPIEFSLGSGSIIPGFEKAVIGMDPGELKTITLSPEEAYGPRDDGRVVEVERDDFPPNIDPEVGQRLQVGAEGGDRQIVTVSKVSDDSVELDANHPLAGQTLTFDIQLVDVS